MRLVSFRYHLINQNNSLQAKESLMPDWLNCYHLFDISGWNNLPRLAVFGWPLLMSRKMTYRDVPVIKEE